jgi:hypothetical protein
VVFVLCYRPHRSVRGNESHPCGVIAQINKGVT